MKAYTELKSRPENKARLTKDARIELDRFNPLIRFRVRSTFSARKHHWRRKHPEEVLAKEKISKIDSNEAIKSIEHRKELARLDDLKRAKEIKAKREALMPKVLTNYTVYASRIIQDSHGRAIIGNDPIPLNVNPEAKSVLEKYFGADNNRFVPSQHEGGNINKVLTCQKCDSKFYSQSDLNHHSRNCKVFKRFKRSK